MARNKRSGRKRRNGNGNGLIKVPQRQTQLLDFTKFQPSRKLVVATQATLSATPLALAFSTVAPPGNFEILAISSLRLSFESARVVSIKVMFDQRGAASTGSQPRVTAFLLNKNASTVDPTKLVGPASFAGSGLNMMTPGRPFILPVGPRFASGTFNSTTINTLLLVGIDYEGTVRIHTTFEVLGPPIDLGVALDDPCGCEDYQETDDI